MKDIPEKNSLSVPDDDMFGVGEDNEMLIQKKHKAARPAAPAAGASPAAKMSPAASRRDNIRKPAAQSPSPASQRRTPAPISSSDAATRKRAIPVSNGGKVAPTPASLRRSDIAEKRATHNASPAPAPAIKDKAVPTVKRRIPENKISAPAPMAEDEDLIPVRKSRKSADKPAESPAAPASRPVKKAVPAEPSVKADVPEKELKLSELKKEVLPVSEPPLFKDRNKKKEKESKKEKAPSAQNGGNMMASIVKAIIYMVVVVVISAFISIFVIRIGNDVFAFVKDDVTIDVTIPEGAGINEITDILADGGIIKYPQIFKLYASLKHDEEGFIPGDYTVSPSMSYDELRYAFKKHVATGTSWITIPEGFTTDEIIDLMVSNNIGERDKYIDVINNYDFDFWFIDELKASKPKDGRAYRLDGYLFPDTYEFYNASSEEMVIRKLLTRFDEVFVQDYKTKAKELGYSVDEILTLASLIEKEAGGTSDYMYVSSVFHNRLKNFEIPRLDSDASIVYGIQVKKGKRPTTITHADLSFESPYNTYTNPGLPPGPITNPSASAIRYALYPANTQYYYFVTADNGKAFYAETSEAHAYNIEQVNAINAKLAEG